MKNTFISLVITADGNLNGNWLHGYADYLEKNYSDYEILIIDYGRGDDNNHNKSELLASIAKMRWLKITDACSLEVAMAAGMENAIGDIIVIGSEENLTEEIIGRAVDECFAGNDIVIGCSRVYKPFWYRMGSRMFRLCARKLIRYNLPANDTWFRAISRRAANAVMADSRFHLMLLMRISNCGYECRNLKYELSGKLCRYPGIIASFSRAVSMMVFNSTRPLRVFNGLGLAASMLAFIFGAYSVLIHLWKNNVLEGWTTTILFMSILFFIMFLILSLFGEYLARLLEDRADVRAYNVVYERHSSVMLDMDRLNVAENSEASEVNLVQTGRDR